MAEIRQGALDAAWGIQKSALLQQYLADFGVLHSDDRLCSIWAEVRNQSRKNGHPIGIADAWIAATAISLTVPLLTNNAKDYSHVESLDIITADPDG
ncbi:MAG: PIN domain-containing protein [Bryobacteraceae bacterium]